MKLKTIKPHFWGIEYKKIGSIYTADKIHSSRVITRGICTEVKKPVKKKEDKRDPITKKGAIEKK